MPKIAVLPGLIPACAGKTGVKATRCPGKTAHPRVCGENPTVAGAGVGAGGSSPRVRGKPTTRYAAHKAARLIPACAGKTSLRVQRRWKSRAHPRVCGENAVNILSNPGLAGSSPRVRGKHRDVNRFVSCRGLIPACAGKTLSTTTSPKTLRAHPRVCGENRPSGIACSPIVGSSPRVRGKPDTRPGRRRPCRLIPACAGKTPPAPTAAGRERAHPRVCGENGGDVKKENTTDGSSPRVRGKP